MNLLLLVAIIVIVAAVLLALKAKKPVADAGLTFEKRDPLFSPAERSFLGVLEQSLDSRYRVLGKVRLGDIVKPAKGLSNSKRQTAQNKINQKHLDFVVCLAADLAVVGVVELDDKSHEREDRVGRDAFIDQALASAKIPVVHIPVKKGYELQELRAKLVESFKIMAETAVPIVVKEEIPVLPVAVWVAEQSAPVCPKCAADMLKRLAKNGPHEGKFFWACSTYPKCRQVVAIE